MHYYCVEPVSIGMLYVTVLPLYTAAILSMYLDINECLSSPCGQTCTNTPGSFVCSCNDGYILDSDGTSCLGLSVCTVYDIQ